MTGRTHFEKTKQANNKRRATLRKFLQVLSVAAPKKTRLITLVHSPFSILIRERGRCSFYESRTDWGVRGRCRLTQTPLDMALGRIEILVVCLQLFVPDSSSIYLECSCDSGMCMFLTRARALMAHVHLLRVTRCWRWRGHRWRTFTFSVLHTHSQWCLHYILSCFMMPRMTRVDEAA